MQFSLRDLVEKRHCLTWDKELSIMIDVCCGLQYLHNRNPPIVHRDLTPNNILLCSHFRAKITDLGVAKIMHTTDTKTLTQAPGTLNFMPPECLADKPVYGLPLDIFSFGGVILYICAQQWPELTSFIEFDPDTGKKIVLTELQRRQQYLDEMTGVREDLKSLVISCLDDNPKTRPPVAQALLEIKSIQNAYSENMYCTISTIDNQSQKNQSLHLQQSEHDQQHKQDQQHEQDQQHK